MPVAQADRELVFSEYQLKAAFLYNLPQFVDWPAGAYDLSNLTLCIVGSDPFGPPIHFFSGRRTKNSTFRVEQRALDASLEGCPIVFVSTTDTVIEARILRSLSGSAVLSVGETSGFTRRGGIIRFILKEERVALEINTEAARAAGLSISPKLLRLAAIVEHPVPEK